jgi:amino acid transporter
MAQHKRQLGLVALLFTSVGGILGSGWLFGPLYAAQMAGPASLVSWVVGGVAVSVVALTFAELGTMFPVNGGIVRYALISYGRTVGFVVSLCAWLTFTVIVAAEVQAVLQYLSIYFPWLTYPAPDGSHPLTRYGFICAAGIWVAFSVVNWLGVHFFARVNTPLTWFKIVLVVGTTLSLLVLAFDIKMFDDLAEGGFAPEGSSGVFRALAYGGVVYAYTGFQHAAVAAGESKNPRRDVPIALIGSLMICMVLYMGLQLAFLGALRPDDAIHGWSKLHFQGAVGPLAGLARNLGAVWLFWLVFVGAIAGPLGAGLIDMASSLRIAQCMAHDRYLPERLGRPGRRQTSALLIALSFPIGMFLFLPFPGWQQLVAFLASVIVLPYTMGPLCLIALREQLPSHGRPFHLKFAHGICPLAFVICGLLLYWAGWLIVWKLGLIIGVMGNAFVIFQLVTKRPLDFRAALWLLPYLGGLMLITWLGGHGGSHLITHGWALAIVTCWCLLCYAVALPLALSSNKARHYAQLLDAMHEEENRVSI